MEKGGIVIRDSRIMAWISKSEKEDFKEALAERGLDIPTYLRYRIHDFCNDIETRIRSGEAEEQPSRRERRDPNEVWVELSLRLDARLKERLDRALKYVPESRNELIRTWIREFISEDENTK